MSDYIKRETILNHYKKCSFAMVKAVIAYIENLPAADVVPVKHGTWEKTNMDGFLRCSACHDCYIEEIWLDGERERWNFCPHCGTKMDGGDDDE